MKDPSKIWLDQENVFTLKIALTVTNVLSPLELWNSSLIYYIFNVKKHIRTKYQLRRILLSFWRYSVVSLWVGKDSSLTLNNIYVSLWYRYHQIRICMYYLLYKFHQERQHFHVTNIIIFITKLGYKIIIKCRNTCTVESILDSNYTTWHLQKSAPLFAAKNVPSHKTSASMTFGAESWKMKIM